jgi:hypothetical protein
MKLKIENKGTAPRGVYTEGGGEEWVLPGRTRTLDVSEAQAKRLRQIADRFRLVLHGDFNGAPPEAFDHDKSGEPGGSTPNADIGALAGLNAAINREAEQVELTLSGEETEQAPAPVENAPPLRPEDMEDDQLRETIERLTGEAPHHRTGRTKLIEQVNAALAATVTTDDEPVG